MPRKYVRVKTNVLPTDEALKNAIVAVHSKVLSIRHAAERFNLSKSTVGFYCKRHTLESIALDPKTTIKTKHHSQIFSRTQEDELVEYLQHCCLLNHGLTTNETRKLALQYAVANKVKTPTSWITRQEASRDWFTAFLKRNHVLSIRKPEATSQARAAGFNKVVVSHFYDNLRDIYEKFKIPQCDVWNGDETNVPTVMQPPDVIATKGLKQVSQTVSAERGVNVTMLVFVNAIGSSTPPVFVFPRKKQNPDLIKGGPTGCLGLVHESGWMTAENFLLSLQHFHGIVKSTKEKPVLLTLDNHSSHIDYNVVKFAKDNGIILLTFPPHCSHALQPLDVSVFGPFKSALKKSHNQWLQDHPGQRISIKEVAHLCRVPYMEKVIPGNITPGFQKTGIYPFNRDVIPDTRYAPASVTDQPEIEQHATSDNVTEPRMTQDVISHPDVVFELEETREEVQISGDPATPTITLTDIRPLPKVSQTTPKARRSQKQVSRLGRTRILTNTPEINVIAEHHQRQSEKIEKSRRRLQPASEKINNKKGKQKIIIDMETTSNEDYSVKKKVNVTSTKAQSKKKVSLKQQNDSVSNAGDELIETPVISGEIRTRTGRLVKPSIYRSL